MLLHQQSHRLKRGRNILISISIPERRLHFSVPHPTLTASNTNYFLVEEKISECQTAGQRTSKSVQGSNSIICYSTSQGTKRSFYMRYTSWCAQHGCSEKRQKLNWITWVPMTAVPFQNKALTPALSCSPSFPWHFDYFTWTIWLQRLGVSSQVWDYA